MSALDIWLFLAVEIEFFWKIFQEGKLIEFLPSKRHNPLIEHWISDKANGSILHAYV